MLLRKVSKKVIQIIERVVGVMAEAVTLEQRTESRNTVLEKGYPNLIHINSICL